MADGIVPVNERLLTTSPLLPDVADTPNTPSGNTLSNTHTQNALSCTISTRPNYRRAAERANGWTHEPLHDMRRAGYAADYSRPRVGAGVVCTPRGQPGGTASTRPLRPQRRQAIVLPRTDFVVFGGALGAGVQEQRGKEYN